MLVIPNPLCVFFGVHLYEFSLVTTCKSLKLGGGGFKFCCCLFSSRTSREIRSNLTCAYFSGGKKKQKKAGAVCFFFVRYALLFSFPGNEGVTLQLQSPHLTTVEAKPVEFCWSWSMLSRALAGTTGSVSRGGTLPIGYGVTSRGSCLIPLILSWSMIWWQGNVRNSGVF